jgi:uncharacterized protein (DUF2237 family)
VRAEFLALSRSRGNGQSTPQPAFGFPGLKPGDRWCLCAERYEVGKAPRVVLSATHEASLDIVSMVELKRFALDLA